MLFSRSSVIFWTDTGRNNSTGISLRKMSALCDNVYHALARSSAFRVDFVKLPRM